MEVEVKARSQQIHHRTEPMIFSFILFRRRSRQLMPDSASGAVPLWIWGFPVGEMWAMPFYTVRFGSGGGQDSGQDYVQGDR